MAIDRMTWVSVPCPDRLDTPGRRQETSIDRFQAAARARTTEFFPPPPKVPIPPSVNAGEQEERSVSNARATLRGPAERQRFPGQRAKPFRRSTQHWELPCPLSIPITCRWLPR